MDKKTEKMDFSTDEVYMHTQTYFHTVTEPEANQHNDTVELQVNCTGAVSRESFSNRSTRKDYYYIYVLKGSMVTGEGVLNPGDVMIYEPGYVYQYQNQGDTTYLWVHFTGFLSRKLTETAVFSPNQKQHIGLREDIVDCFKRLFKEFMIHDEVTGELSLCLLKQILCLTGRYVGTVQKKNVPILSIEYIHSHLQENLEIDELAKLEHMSPTAYRIAFRNHTGVSPNEYIIAQRISTACRLLSQTDLSVRAVAGEVGCHDQYYFSRLFKKKAGVTPLKYRNQSMENP